MARGFACVSKMWIGRSSHYGGDGKSNKNRIATLPEWFCRRRWIINIPMRGRNERDFGCSLRLLVARPGGVICRHQVHEANLQRSVKLARETAGLVQPVTPHSLRHGDGIRCFAPCGEVSLNTKFWYLGWLLWFVYPWCREPEGRPELMMDKVTKT